MAVKFQTCVRIRHLAYTVVFPLAIVLASTADPVPSAFVFQPWNSTPAWLGLHNVPHLVL